MAIKLDLIAIKCLKIGSKCAGANNIKIHEGQKLNWIFCVITELWTLHLHNMKYSYKEFNISYAGKQWGLLLSVHFKFQRIFETSQIFIS